MNILTNEIRQLDILVLGDGVPWGVGDTVTKKELFDLTIDRIAALDKGVRGE